MDIEDAFTKEAIDLAETNVGGEMETEIREMIQRVCQANEVELTHDEESIAVLCFVAGRTYQADQELFQVPMSRPMLLDYMEYLRRERDD